MKKIYTIISLALSLCLLTVSCQREDMESLDGGAVSTEVSILPSVSSSDEVIWTRGELINRGGEGNIPFPTTKTFFATAWDAAGTSASIPWNEVKYLSAPLGETGLPRNMWKPTGGDGKIIEYNWKPGVVKTFYAYANLPEGTGYSATVAKDATSGCPAMTVNYVVPTTAEAQQDLLLGCYKGVGDGEIEGKTNGTAKIVFSHALTAVSFQLGTIVGAASFEVTSLGIEGITLSGSALMTDDGNIVWTPSEDGGELDTKSVSQSVTSTPVPTAEDPTPEIGEPFMIIPQSFGSDSKARLKIGIRIDGRDVNIYQPLKDVSWKAGEVNIYTVDYNGHEGIQLWENGPYWATKNVGAEKPEDCGWYFAWGETTGYVCRDISLTPDDWSPNMINPNASSTSYSCHYYSAPGGILREGGFAVGNYNPKSTLTGNIPINPDYDAAQAHMGIKWRMPTKEECEDLIAKTNRTYTSRNGVVGFLFTGKEEGYTHRSIFIPASGRAHTELISDRWDGTFHMEWNRAVYLWSRSYDTSSYNGYEMILGYNTYGPSITEQHDVTYAAVRYDWNHYGRAIRAVENTDYNDNAGN